MGDFLERLYSLPECNIDLVDQENLKLVRKKYSFNFFHEYFYKFLLQKLK